MTPFHDLERLLSPIEPKVFLEQHWGKRSLFVLGWPEKFATLFSHAEWEAACERRSARPPDRRAGTYGAFTASSGEQHQFTVTPQSAPALSKAVTICASGIEEDSPPLAVFLDNIKRSMGLLDDVTFNCYVSPDNQGYSLHYDVQDVIVLQIEGTKRWRFSQLPAVECPLRPASFSTDGRLVSPMIGSLSPPDEASFEEVLLKPGSLLHLPAGVWHVARAEGSSLALTLSCTPRRVRNLLLEVLDEVLSEQLWWRQRIPTAFESSQRGEDEREAVRRTLERHLESFKTAVARLEVDSLCRQWREQAESLERPRGLPKRLG